VPNKGKETGATGAIANPPTHMEIAIMLNVSRETVTRVFQALQKQQIVRRDGSTNLIINQVKKLKDFAEGKDAI
jgi:DNA-binding transcriptional regulator YhcF (GntR family)